MQTISIERRDDCQQLKPKGTQTSLGNPVIAVTILLILSILFSRVTVNAPVRCVFHLIVYIVAHYMYDDQRLVLHYQQVLR